MIVQKERQEPASFRGGTKRSRTTSTVSPEGTGPSCIAWKPIGSPLTAATVAVSGHTTSPLFLTNTFARAGTEGGPPVGSTTRPTQYAWLAPTVLASSCATSPLADSSSWASMPRIIGQCPTTRAAGAVG